MNFWRRFSWKIWLLLAFAVAVGAITWLMLKSSEGRTIRLQDGRVLTLVSVTYGTDHRYVYGRPLVKAVAPVMPEKWSRDRGLRVANYTSAVPANVVWFLCGRTDPIKPSTFASVADDAGNETEPAWVATAMYLVSGEVVRGWVFENFPRRAKDMRFQFIENDMAGVPHVLGEFRLPNHGPRRHPNWKAETLPAVRRDGDLEFVLGDAQSQRLADVPARYRFRQRAPYPVNWNSAMLQVRQQGKPSLDWQIAGLTVTDPTGNVCDTRNRRFESVGDFLFYSFDGLLWPQESAFKFKVEFSRQNGFASNELCAVARLALAPLNTTTILSNPPAAPHGIQLKQLALQRVQGGPYLPGDFRRNAMLQVQTASALPAGIRLSLARAVDDRGWPVWSQPTLSLSNTIHAFELCVPAGATNLDFALAFQRSRFAEFLVKPRRIPLLDYPPAPSR